MAKHEVQASHEDQGEREDDPMKGLRRRTRLELHAALSSIMCRDLQPLRGERG